MTDSQKRRDAIATELEQLAQLSRSFALVVADAEKFTEELQAAFSRINAIEREAKLDWKIDNLDFMLRRGEYSDALTETYFPDLDVALSKLNIFGDEETIEQAAMRLGRAKLQ